MAQEKYDIFISYRRKDENGKEWGTSVARNILQALEDRGYKGRVFFDHNKIGPEDFEKKILGAIKQAKVFLCILTKNAMDNCVNEGDWVRREICQAIESGLKIIFLNPDNEFNHNDLPKKFPDELAIVKKQNSLEIRSGQKFEIDLDDIVENHISSIVPRRTISSPKSQSFAPVGRLRIDTDLDCRVLNYGNEVGVAKAGVYTTLELPLGDNDLVFVGLESDKDRYGEMVTLLENHQKLVRVRLLDKYNARKEKEEAERARIKAEILARAKAKQAQIEAERRAKEEAARKAELERIETERRAKAKLSTISQPKTSSYLSKTQSNQSLGTKIKKWWEGLLDSEWIEEVLPYFMTSLAFIPSVLLGVFIAKNNKPLEVFESEGMYGYKYSSGKIIIPAKYDDADSFSDGLAKVKLNGKWGFIDKTDKEVVPFKYDDAESFSEGLAAVKLNGKHGFIDKTGKEIIPFKYDYADYFSEGLARVVLNDKWGFIDKTGKEVIPFKYDSAYSFSEGLADVKLNGKYGFIDTTGKEIIPAKYDFAYSFHEGLAKVKLDGKYGFIDKTGKEIISLKYEVARDFNNGKSHVKLNGEWFYIDKNGNRIENN